MKRSFWLILGAALTVSVAAFAIGEGGALPGPTIPASSAAGTNGAALTPASVAATGAISGTTGTFSGQVKSNGTNVLTQSRYAVSTAIYVGSVAPFLVGGMCALGFYTGPNPSVARELSLTEFYNAGGGGNMVIGLTLGDGGVVQQVTKACADVEGTTTVSGRDAGVALAANTFYCTRLITACASQNYVNTNQIITETSP